MESAIHKRISKSHDEDVPYKENNVYSKSFSFHLASTTKAIDLYIDGLLRQRRNFRELLSHHLSADCSFDWRSVYTACPYIYIFSIDKLPGGQSIKIS